MTRSTQTQRDDGELVSRREVHRARGGSIPASSLFVRFGEVADANELVLLHHYSHRTAANVQLVATLHERGGLFGTCGPAVAAVTYSIPPTRWSVPVWELSRLVRVPSLQFQLSFLVARSVSECRRRGVHLLVSFADQTEGHVGYVYRASNWNYHGMRPPRMTGVLVNGQYVPGRSANSAFGTRSPSKLATQLGVEVEGVFDAGKHLYWLPLSKTGRAWARELGLDNGR